MGLGDECSGEIFMGSHLKWLVCLFQTVYSHHLTTWNIYMNQEYTKNYRILYDRNSIIFHCKYLIEEVITSNLANL